MKRAAAAPTTTPAAIDAVSSPYLLEREAAAYLRMSHHTLANRRVSGKGPAFSKDGRKVLYRIADLDAFVAKNLRRSTSDVEGQPPTPAA